MLTLTSRSLDYADTENERFKARLSELVDRDPLTGVFNRRRLDEELVRQLAVGRRNGKDLSLLSLDLDGFKAINDSLGHAAGDELIILLPETSAVEAATVAEKLIESLHRVIKRR